MKKLTDELKKYYQECTIDKLNESFIGSCINGHLELIQYVLTFPDLQVHADINTQNGKALTWACARNHLDIVEYLLTSSELKEHANIHANNYHAFRRSLENGLFNMAQYLLSFNGEQCIQFQTTPYNLDWAISNKFDDLIIAMMQNLHINDFMNYLDNLEKVEQYDSFLCEKIKKLMSQHISEHSKEEFLFI